MIALDTNVIARLLIADDHDQSERTAVIIDSLTSKDPALICRETLVELVWMLDRTCGFGRVQISGAIHELIDSSEIIVEDVDRVRNVLRDYQSLASDFSDLMIHSAAIALGENAVVTFNKRFAESANVELLN